MASALVSLESGLLKLLSPGEPHVCTGAAYAGKSKIRILLGDAFLARMRGKTVLDFGCGDGADVVELARLGAKRVIGIDIREDLLEKARERARTAGVERICYFGTKADQSADLIVSLDCFEHFDDPGAILRIMHELLASDGEVIASFGPTWYHPYGGHLFSIFPWAHLLFSEAAMIRWRSTFKSDGARSFRECQGGLNQMTVGRFERVVKDSPFEFAELELVPIRRLQGLQNRFTREFTTAIIRCRLRRRASHAAPTTPFFAKSA